VTRAGEAILTVLLVFGVAGCVGFTGYYDADADRYADVLRRPPPPPCDKKVRYTVNIEYYVGGDRAGIRREEREKLRALACRTVIDTRIFKIKNIYSSHWDPDCEFIFDVTITDTGTPGLLAGMIVPFLRTREYSVRLRVLNRAGEVIVHYAASAAMLEARHTLLFFLAPFYPPSCADDRTVSNVFKALSVKLIRDCKDFLQPQTWQPTRRTL